MAESRVFEIEVFVEEDVDHTEAKAYMSLRGREFAGWGRARRNPNDPNIPMIGEELALARALDDLGHALLDAAAGAIEEYEGREAEIRL